jgi:hypothetical protein
MTLITAIHKLLGVRIVTAPDELDITGTGHALMIRAGTTTLHVDLRQSSIIIERI